MLKYSITKNNEGRTPITTTVIKPTIIYEGVTLMFIRKKHIMGIALLNVFMEIFSPKYKHRPSKKHTLRSNQEI